MSVEDARGGNPAGGGDGLLMGGGAPAGGKDPLVGRRIGQCLIQRRLGAGTMGRVYLAQHLGLNKPVAVKILSPQLAETGANIQDILRDAKLSAGLEHPHAAKILEVGEADGLAYLATQYVDGRGLDKILDEQGKLGAREAGDIVRKIALALGAAHALGIIHRDLKPSNVLRAKDGQIKVTDFGLARADESAPSLSSPGPFVGTPDYMSPERAQGLPPDARSDLYSLGATYFHLVTGRRPFEGDSPMGIMLKHVNDPPPSPDQVEPAVRDIILKLLAKNPEDRFQSAEELLGALDGAVEKSPEPAGPTMDDLFKPEAAAEEPAPAPPEKVSTPPPSERTKLILGKYLKLREIRKVDDDLTLWEGEDVGTRARVILRILAGQDEERVKAFEEVAEDAADFKHPNILQVVAHERGTMAVEGAGLVSLEEVVTARTLPRKRLIQICEQIAGALEFAHQKRRTHLAISPWEVYVEPPAKALISFHGLGPSRADPAKAAAFLAPEQVPGAEATTDARTDVYRLGALLYWMVTGKAPFQASTVDGIHLRVRTTEPKGPMEVDPTVEAELDRVIRTAMRKEKEARFASAQDLANALRKHLLPKDVAPSSRRLPKVTWQRRLVDLLRSNVKRLAVAGAILLLLAAGRTLWRQRRGAEALAEEIGSARLEAFNRHLEGKYEEALASAGRALALSPADEGMLRLSKACQRKILEAAVLEGVARLEEAAQDKAEKAFQERAAALDEKVRELRSALGAAPAPEDGPSVTAAGIGAFQLGLYEAAAELLEKAAELGSKDPGGALTLARACVARIACANAAARILGPEGDPEERADEWRARTVQAMERPTRPAREGADADLADIYAAIGRSELERAKSLAGGLLRRNPGPAVTAEALALRAWAAGGADTSDLDASVRALAAQALAYVMRAARHAERARLAEAAADLGVAERLFRSQPLFPLLRCKIRIETGDLEGAREDLARATSLAGPEWEFRAALEGLARALEGK